MYEEAAAALPQTQPPAGAEPTERVSRGWTARFSLAWLGFWAAQFVPVQLTLPDELERIDPAHKIRDFGAITGAAAVISLLTLPLCGALCDRTRSRWGRRRVWMAAGVALTAAGLVLAGFQATPIGLGLAWLWVTVGISATTAGLTATVADQVPEGQRGMISGAMYAPQAVGIVAGIAAVSAFGLNSAQTYRMLAAALVLCAIPFILRYRDTAPVAAPPSSLWSPRRGMRAAPRGPDFRWALTSRLMVNLANTLGVCYLLYFLTDQVHAVNPEDALLLLTLLYVLGMLVTSVLGGALSDRLGRRRVFVGVAVVLQGAAALALALVPSLKVATFAAAVFGAGFGTYMSVDQALVTAVLPDAGSRARDLGLMNIASLVPQAFAPLAAGLIITTLGGYPALYVTTAVTAALSGFAVLRVRAVR
ncbi:MFS family permease [Streptomyces sp. LBL]|uniref:MFS transporter n=1 Tax=Streptomyces sp. LBL TaxID=2940562 RepID=UPI002473E940|nr:MFS transporter [Streptomyces sp. LBL]MDH6622665.1 MFS family permease [Streptomyces sp. LBL]